MADSEKETITISRCPVCSEDHSYTLKVTRSITIGYLQIDSYLREKPRRVRITRLFTCPTKNQEFQVTFSLLEYPRQPIKTVEVEKSKTENEEESGNG